MVEITKAEVKYLESKGYRWHEEIHASTTRNHYYAVEAPWVLADLRRYRKAVTS